jgi:hypothetical protein
VLVGFALPHTPSGRSAPLTAPPSRSAGTILPVAHETAGRAATASLRPAGFGRAIGGCRVHAGEWQATTDGAELLDPVWAQDRGMSVLVQAQRPDGIAEGDA